MKRSVFLGMAAVIFLCAGAADAVAQSHPAGLCKAGTVGFGVGQAGIVVPFSVPWPVGTAYVVVVQPTNTAGYSTTASCTYFNVLKKINTQFEVQHKTCDSGVPIALDTAVSLDWIACPVQQ